MCDTFVALPSATADGSIIFGKNSDREPNEAQALEYHPAETFSPGDELACTYLTIPQAKETLATVLCRPFWMWGAEMGANEKGLVIGNEAVFTRMPLDRKGGLTGMDLLRLALERSGSAQQALETIVKFLADFGQGGICGYEDKRMAYHNSFIIADPGEAWVLETAGPLWAALKVEDSYAISNRLTIGERFDESHPELRETARKKGWWKKGKPFDFAHCYSDWFFTTFSASKPRLNRSSALLASQQGKTNVYAAMEILRDHDDSDYRPDSHFLGNRICAHGANKLARNATQTTGSLIAHLTPAAKTYFATGTAAPCTGIFKPFRFGQQVLPDMGPAPDGRYDPDSLWWFHETLHRAVLNDFQTRLAGYEVERNELEKQWIDTALTMSSEKEFDMTREAFKAALEKTAEWIERVRSLPVRRRANAFYRSYWHKQNKKAGMTK